LEEAGQHFEGCGFSCAIWAEETDGFAFVDGEGDVVDGASF
jgi:hypothetical protein